MSKPSPNDAQRLADNPLWRELLETARQEIAEELLETRPDDIEARERLYFEHRVVNRVEERFEIIISRMLVH